MTTIGDRIRASIRDVPDFPKPGIIFKDITPLFADASVHRAMCDAFVERYRSLRIDAFVGIESRGFLVAAPLSAQLEKGLALVRKPGKLPWKTRSVQYELEYGHDTLEIHEDALQPGMRVVVADDLLATGGTMAAACELVQGCGAEIVEAAFIVELAFLKGRAKFGEIPSFSLVEY